jgi:serine/threonine-protein kinase
MERSRQPGPGDTIAGYRLLEQVGEGGMGVVFRARNGSTRSHAVKVLKPERAADESAVDAFRQEARATAAARHESVVAVTECGLEDGVHYLVMEFVDGPPLDRLLADRGRLPWKAAVRIAIQVARALGHAHDLGFLHRDVKPGNVLLFRDGRVRLSDFGIVKDIRSLKGFLLTGRKVGTAAYASPEQVRGRRLGPATDVYSLGATLYHMVAGRPPFTGDARQVAAKQVRADPTPVEEIVPDVPRALSRQIGKMLAKRPTDRIPSMEVVVANLRTILAGRVILGPVSPRSSRRRRARA